jgi:predicted ArsR family transcriptional regulator
MWSNRSNRRFSNSTHGRILALLRGAGATVKDLAMALDLTESAVRTQLASLEREGLVQHSGTRRGIRKPHFIYTLTPLAEQLFPKAYDALLYQVLLALKRYMSADEMESMLLEIGRDLAHQAAVNPSAGLAERVRAAARLLSELGGAAELEQQDGRFVLRGASCPFAAVVPAQPFICQLVATIIAEITQADVQETCVRETPPRCHFTISAKT